eukprot:CAMPEP_0116940518 /NCGR_PEP_ID=MMETSP0467-20121206/33417_1 /TAXON_ID=283647 /ORGANISM="Mesodinium pulex, Strain SPMC105" /LENGTH=87 /DNA_ID=CAMNT_0004623079 /DNA_START=1867 /DNA_END=2130 /DNA_ORIENTATION=+
MMLKQLLDPQEYERLKSNADLDNNKLIENIENIGNIGNIGNKEIDANNYRKESVEKKKWGQSVNEARIYKIEKEFVSLDQIDHNYNK